LSSYHVCAQGHRWQRLPACPVCGAAPGSFEQDDSGTLPADAFPPAVSAVSNVTVPAPESSAAAPPAGLLQVAGYEALRVLGRGGMGVVYLAWQTGLARLVALKTVLAGAHAGPEERARFRTEAEAAARLVHPHIVQIYEIGEADSQPFLALEYVEGGSLAAWLNGQPQPARAAARFVATLAEAVHHAHQRGIIHRDLKPANILLGPRSLAQGPGSKEPGPASLDLGHFDPKITDFGLAKLVVGGASQTASGAILGTPAYMAPEQAGVASAPVGPAADIHSLGAILYELLTGRPPFQAPSVLETLEQVRRQEPVAPRHLVAAVPRDLETVCLKCLHKEPDRRYESALALAEDLHRYQAGEPVRARPVPAWERGLRWMRRHPARAALLGVSCLAVLALTGTLVGLFYNGRLQALNVGLEVAVEQARTSHDALKQLERQVSYERDIHLADEAWHNGQFKRVRELLDGCPRDLHGWEWHYLRGQARDGDFLPHKSGVLAVAFHPDNRHLASGCSDGFVWFWDTVTKIPHLSQERHPGGVWSIAFSPDGRLLASAGEDRLVRLWNPDDGRLLGTLSGHRLAVRCVAFHPAGTMLASAGKDGTIWLWDPRQEREPRKLPVHKGGILALAFAPDGRTLAAGGADRMVRLWDPDTGVEVHSLSGHTGDVYGLAFSPDGKTLASAGTDGILQTWDPTSGLPRTDYRSGNMTAIYAVAFGPGRRIATAGEDHHVRILEGSLMRTFRGHIHRVQGVAFSPDGRTMASASLDFKVKLWKTDSSQEYRSFAKGDTAILAAQFSPDGRLTDVAENGTIRTRDVESGKLLHQWSAGLGRPRFIAFRSDGQLLAAAGRDGRIWCWDLAKGRAISGGWKHNATARAVALSPDGRRLASSGDDKTVKIGDTAGEKAPLSCPAPDVPIHAVAFSPDGETVISGGEDDVRLLDAGTGEELLPLPGPTPKATAFAFGPNGQLAVAQMGGRITLWDFPARRRLGTLNGHSAAVWSLAFTPDGTRLASASRDLTVRLWDTASRKEVLPLQGFAAEVLGVAFSPDGRRLVTTDQAGFVKLWEIERDE
jgi:WD40 repeat protein